MISLIIPCFNEEESLPLFYPEATSVLRQMNCDYELIFVNDGSRDRTLEILKELSEKDLCTGRKYQLHRCSDHMAEG